MTIAVDWDVKPQTKQTKNSQLVASLIADPGIASLIPAQFNTFVEIDHEIISAVIFPPSADSRRVAVSYKRKNVHKVLVNNLVELVQEKVWLY